MSNPLSVSRQTKGWEVTSHEMQQLIRDTYDGVSTVTEVPGNPNLLGHWLFEIDGPHGKAAVYLDPRSGAVWGKGEK